MARVTIMSDEVRTVDGTATDGRILIAPDQLDEAIGWELKPEGLCRQDTCVPVWGTAGLFVGDRLDVAAVARALGRPVVVESEARIAAMALDAEDRRQALEALHAPPFTLDDLRGHAHSLAEWAGQKKLLVAFSSW
jgi:hypothetical protein